MVNDLAREQAVAALSGPGVGVAISAALKWSTIVRLYLKGLDRRYAPLCDDVYLPRWPSDAGRPFFSFLFSSFPHSCITLSFFFLARRASAPSQSVWQLGAPLAALDPELFGCHETVAGFAYTMLRPAKGEGGHEQRSLRKGVMRGETLAADTAVVVERADSCIERITSKALPNPITRRTTHADPHDGTQVHATCRRVWV